MLVLLKHIGYGKDTDCHVSDFYGAIRRHIGGTISEESSILNFRALNIREAHERPEAMEEAAVMMVGLNPERILQGLVQLQNQKTGEERNYRQVSDYSMSNISDKVVRIILSYTDFIKRTIWSEQ